MMHDHGWLGQAMRSACLCVGGVRQQSCPTAADVMGACPVVQARGPETMGCGLHGSPSCPWRPGMLVQVRVVKDAEADAEAKYLQGAGVARQRQAIMAGACPWAWHCCAPHLHAQPCVA